MATENGSGPGERYLKGRPQDMLPGPAGDQPRLTGDQPRLSGPAEPTSSQPRLAAPPQQERLAAPDAGHSVPSSTEKTAPAADAEKIGKNSKWRGRLAYYGSVLAVVLGGTYYADNQGKPVVDDKGDPKTGITAEQKAKDQASYGKMDQKTRDELFHQKQAKGTWGQDKTPAQQRMDQYAQAETDRLTYHGPEGTPGTYATLSLAGLGIAGLFSRMAKSRTGLTIPDHFNGPRSYAEAAYNTGLHKKAEVEITGLKQEARANGDGLLASAASERVKAVKEEAAGKEVPNEWFGTVRGKLLGDRVDIKHVPDTSQPAQGQHADGSPNYPYKEVAVAKPGETRAEIAAKKDKGPSGP